VWGGGCLCVSDIEVTITLSDIDRCELAGVQVPSVGEPQECIDYLIVKDSTPLGRVDRDDVACPVRVVEVWVAGVRQKISVYLSQETQQTLNKIYTIVMKNI